MFVCLVVIQNREDGMRGGGEGGRGTGPYDEPRRGGRDYEKESWMIPLKDIL